MERKILDVSQVNEYIKGLMDTDELLTGLCIRGELSNYKIYPSGHHYFTLKDAGGALRGQALGLQCGHSGDPSFKDKN